MKRNFLKLSFLALSAFAVSCGNGGTDDGNGIDSTAVVEDTSNTVTTNTDVSYQVPSPNDMFSLIKQASIKGKNTSMLNSTSNAKNYVDNKMKALNFGIYSTDLLYCSSFDFGSDALKYFVTVKKLGDDIGISTAIKESTAKRIEDNIGNNDSLQAISNDLYASSFSTLEGNDRGTTLSLVIAGGWVESLFIVTNMVPKYAKDDAAVERVAEQKYALDNLIEYMKRYEADANVASVVTSLGELKAIFDAIEEKDAGASTMSGEGKKRVLGGGTKLVITEEQYKQVVEKTAAIRKSFTETK